MKKLFTILCTSLLLAVSACQQVEPIVEPETVKGAQVQKYVFR